MSRSKSEKLIWIESVVSNPPEGCAIWPFPRFNTGGYGGICYQGRTHNAHRVALMLATGVNPKGLVAGHGPCHNPACCNPNHLSWLTHSENQNDRLRDGTETRSPLTDEKTTGWKIRRQRKALRVSQIQLGKLTGLTTKRLSEIECGKKEVTTDDLVLIANGLNTTPAALQELTA